MALTPRLELRARQKLALSPQVRMRLGLLRLSALELDEELARAAALNPFLLHDPAPAGSTPGVAVEDIATLARDEPFQDTLHRQLIRRDLPAPILALALALVSELRPDGFLDAALDALAEEFSAPLSLLEAALEVVQSCDPPGIGARNMAEFLMLNLTDRGLSAAEARATLGQLGAFSRQDLAAAGAALGLDRPGVEARAALLRDLPTQPITPRDEGESVLLRADLRLVRHGDGTLAIVAAVEALPRLRLDHGLVRQARSGAGTAGFAPDLLERAQALIAALEQRGATLLRIGDWVLARQPGFFAEGPRGLVPATQAEMAQALALHPSTISRALAGKGLDVDGRLWPLGSFFSSALAGARGPVSSRAVQRQIAQMIGAETVGSPLSDEDIAAMLRAEGVDIARRTVTKYRQGLRIPSSTSRRRLAASRRRG